MTRSSSKPKPVVLCILDGWGMGKDGPTNAITQANPSNFNKLWFSYPHALLSASGSSVGLPNGVVGNSEVGHLNLGAGRIVLQDVLRIDMAIENNSFFQNDALKKAASHALTNNSKVHVMGLVSPGAVHSKIGHLMAILNFLKAQNISSKRVKIHMFTDGRDSPPTLAKSFVPELENEITQNSLGEIASISGRYYAMDRDNRWDRTEKAYDILTLKSPNPAKNAKSAIEDSYLNGIMDEFIKPIQIENSESASQIVEDNDSVIFFNFRPDRARQLTKAFVLDNLKNLKTSSNKKAQTFERKTKLQNVFFTTMTKYEEDLAVSAVAIPPVEINTPLARIISERDQKQLHIAETEKYAHVTYFFNGGRENPFNGEERILIDSQKVATYDLSPQMSAPEITKKLLPAITGKTFDLIVVNFANADMVSHTGNLEATVEAIKTVDAQIGLIYNTILTHGGALIITADHGNAEVMENVQTGEADTEHNTSPVPCIIVTGEYKNKPRDLHKGILADVAPTILSLMKIPKPTQMTGRNLLE